MVGTKLTGLMRPADGRELEAALRAAAAKPDSVRTLEFPLWHRDGRWRETETTITSLVAEPHVRGIVLNTRDVSERRRLQKELMHQAYSDALTGLANRALFRERTRAALADAADVTTSRCSSSTSTASRPSTTRRATPSATGCSRSSASGSRTACAPATSSPASAATSSASSSTGEQAEDGAVWVADRVRRVLAHDFELDGRQVPLGASIGIALNERGDETADQLLSNADLAMYRAKTSERTEFVRFESAMHEDLLARVQAETDLRTAVAERRPARCTTSRSSSSRPVDVVGVEALARWTHPERGVIDAGRVHRLAEQTGLVDQIGTWALQRGVPARRPAGSGSRDPARGVFRVAVNVSARQITAGFPDVVRDGARGAAALPGDALTIEVTESVLMERPDEAVEILAPGQGARRRGSPSTTSAPATARCPTCRASPSTS